MQNEYKLKTLLETMLTTGEQTLTDTQKTQALTNIGVSINQYVSAHPDAVGLVVRQILNVVEILHTPPYYDAAQIAGAPWAAFGVTDAGWYAFLRIGAPAGVTVGAGFAVTGGNAQAPAIGDTYVDVAVALGVAPQSYELTIAWGAGAESSYYVRAIDLAIRNLDYRATYYMYDMDNYATYTWALTADAAFTSTARYYTRTGVEGDYTYTLAVAGTDYTVDQAVPADTYYVHAAVTLSGYTQNISYILAVLDCPATINLPAIEGSSYGAWVEVQFVMPVAKALTLVPPDGVTVSGSLGMTPTAGVNVFHAQYHAVNHQWRVLVTNWPAQSA